MVQINDDLIIKRYKRYDEEDEEIHGFWIESGQTEYMFEFPSESDPIEAENFEFYLYQLKFEITTRGDFLKATRKEILKYAK